MHVALARVFPDQFAANVAILAVGVAAAVVWLRTGMVVRGAALLVALACAADVALVARFVYGDRGTWFILALAAMQVASITAAAWLSFCLWQRRWSPVARRRRELFATGFRHYLRGEFTDAEVYFRRLRRVDPWDVPAAIALANVWWRCGEVRRARRLLRTARLRDRKDGYRDFIAAQLRRMEGGEPRLDFSRSPGGNEAALPLPRPHVPP